MAADRVLAFILLVVLSSAIIYALYSSWFVTKTKS
ncbi:hypothetical protein EDD73_12226 [Heliophilum fasciatum]|uniref:Uncharacterized protein n=1 Tax=Heliophilum fasciatum TaxID=35700 RepID=A0A4V2SWJ1_9FIRM|nr:hypothetical protein [Heliophilum fasciatum]TCP62456.1 hypothetical protein EDD73_12226 [Heliophilum fasciatum]